MSKYKIGDRVRIRSNLKSNMGAIEAMEIYEGKIAVITNSNYSGSVYEIDIDNNKHFWTDSMFEDAPIQLFKVGDKVRIKNSKFNRNSRISNHIGETFIIKGVTSKYYIILHPGDRTKEGDFLHDRFELVKEEIKKDKSIIKLPIRRQLDILGL